MFSPCEQPTRRTMHVGLVVFFSSPGPEALAPVGARLALPDGGCGVLQPAACSPCCCCACRWRRCRRRRRPSWCSCWWPFCCVAGGRVAGARRTAFIRAARCGDRLCAVPLACLALGAFRARLKHRRRSSAPHATVSRSAPPRDSRVHSRVHCEWWRWAAAGRPSMADELLSRRARRGLPDACAALMM